MFWSSSWRFYHFGAVWKYEFLHPLHGVHTVCTVYTCCKFTSLVSCRHMSVVCVYCFFFFFFLFCFFFFFFFVCVFFFFFLLCVLFVCVCVCVCLCAIVIKHNHRCLPNFLALSCRNSTHTERPTAVDILGNFCKSERVLLAWRSEDPVPPLSRTLGAPLSEGETLHRDLQNKYKDSLVKQ